MTINRSMAISHFIENQMDSNMYPILMDYLPSELIRANQPSTSRNRIFTIAETISLLILNAMSKEKSYQKTVLDYQLIHRNQIDDLQEIERRAIEKHNAEKRPGRPRKRFLHLPKSKYREISLNTSAFTQAVTRLPYELLDMVFKESSKISPNRQSNNCFNKDVYITDGTYLQLQDTAEINEQFNKPDNAGYPRGLLAIISHLQTGKLTNYILSSDAKSELELLMKLLMTLPRNSLLLADDLYSSLAVWILARLYGIDIIVPGKRKRNYIVLKKIANGDEIVELQTCKSSKMMEIFDLPQQKVIMRRIEYVLPNSPDVARVLYTTILDEQFTKDQFINMYISRWNIEISIREIKTILGINILHNKKPDSVLKELCSSLIAYNYLREMIYEAVEDTDFSPERDFFQKFYYGSDIVHVDKLGRVYSHWSPGRKGYEN